MDARISFRGWVLLSSIAFCIALWWWLLSAVFTPRTDKACQAEYPQESDTCRRLPRPAK